MKQITIEQARQTDLVDYLNSAGHHPQKNSHDDYWFLSPLREEKTASFKVNRKLNVWYDFGLGKGGNFIDFGVLFHQCTVSELLQKLSDNSQVFTQDLLPTAIKKSQHLPSSDFISRGNAKTISADSSIIVTDVREISDTFLLNYLRQRRINLSVANTFCREVYFTLNDKNYRAIGFKNNAGGYEIRNAFFK